VTAILARRIAGTRILAICCVAAALSCSSGEARHVAQPDSVQRVRTVVDSILPLEEALRRFREGIPEVTALEGGAPTRDALVERFVRAIEALDTAAVREMVLSRAEFAWLYYPTSTFSREPFYQMPGLTWFLNVEDSQKGITRLFTRFGGTDLRFSSYECPGTIRLDGGLTFWDGCLLDVRLEGQSRQLRLFGSIVEFHGQYKFYSYANDL